MTPDKSTPKGPAPNFETARPRGRWLRRLGLAGLAAGAALSIAGLGAAVWVQKTYLTDLPEIPRREALYSFNRTPAIKFFDRTGRLIAERGPKYGDPVRVAALPAYVPRAMLAAEDRRFYSHGAVDLWAVARAAVANHRAGKVVEGGSTLTQQLAKTLFLTAEQTFKRKVQEAVLAEKLHRMLTKDEILELYLNRVYYGANTFGLDGAARSYFGKPASQLTLSEAALLAAIPKAPTRLALHHGMDEAMARQRLVLQRMAREGWITPQEAAQAAATPPRLAPTAQPNDGDFGWALDYAAGEALRMVGANSPDLLVRLSIDPGLQREGARIVRRTVRAEARSGRMSEGALVALAPDGAIRAMVGGVDYRESVFNRAVQARRQPGSSFKPFIYAAALERGVRPTDVRMDAPIRIGGWRPENYGGGHYGPVMVQTALARSINTVAVRLAREAGPRAIGRLASRFGFTTVPAEPGLSVALGAYEVSVLEMASAFQVFQQAGGRVQPYIIEEVRTVGGERVLIHLPSAPAPAYDAARAGMMLRMMQGTIAYGTGRRADFGWPAAGKTGTSQNWRDAWFVGFTPEFAAAVWVGNDDGRPMRRVTGGDAPARMWRQFMQVAHKGIAPHDFDWLLPSVAPPRYEAPMDAAEPEPDYAQQTDEEPEHPDYPPQDRYAPQGGYYDGADAAFARTSVDGDKGGWGDADWAEPPVDAPF